MAYRHAIWHAWLRSHLSTCDWGCLSAVWWFNYLLHKYFFCVSFLFLRVCLRVCFVQLNCKWRCIYCNSQSHISSARRPAPLRTRYTNRLNPGNNVGVRNVALLLQIVDASPRNDLDRRHISIDQQCWTCFRRHISMTNAGRELIAGQGRQR